jgi:hypothetical protein
MFIAVNLNSGCKTNFKISVICSFQQWYLTVFQQVWVCQRGDKKLNMAHNFTSLLYIYSCTCKSTFMYTCDYTAILPLTVSTCWNEDVAICKSGFLNDATLLSRLVSSFPFSGWHLCRLQWRLWIKFWRCWVQSWAGTTTILKFFIVSSSLHANVASFHIPFNL